MRIQKAAFAVVAVLVGVMVLSFAACGKQPAGPNVVTIVNNNSNTNNNGQSGSDPGESNKTTGSVKSGTVSVTVNGFSNGEKCPAGIAPANQNQRIASGCDLAVTCNPRDKDGKVIQDSAAPAVDYFILATGQDVVSFSQSSANTYNGDIKSTKGKAGKFALICSVVGISSGLQEFEVIP